ncbi:hypothetical protein FF100_11985 [Methylobacterium terricola]|uniref:Uncharacterized protein n=1 Tax=Methylobacterium terricola TaxID=2583531 RepID=A0A5C4LJS5_9HYPH|nr:hypothetical protein [Methylobacterium terricola]TNC13500.1 hypothetical protein FF100_11985 [Methylobacterium terricola]
MGGQEHSQEYGQGQCSGIARLDRSGSLGSARGDIRIVVSAPPAGREKKERASAYLPWPVRLTLKLGLPLVVVLAIVVLPNYLGCRGQHDSGMFFYGITVSACTRQTISDQIAGTQRRFEAIARAVGAH